MIKALSFLKNWAPESRRQVYNNLLNDDDELISVKSASLRREIIAVAVAVIGLANDGLNHHFTAPRHSLARIHVFL